MIVRVTISRPAKPKPSAGDIKTSKQGVFIREQCRHDGCYVVAYGKPVYQWRRLGNAPKDFKGRMRIDYV